MGRDPKAEVEISAHSRGLGARLREARAKFSNFGGELKKHVFGKELVEKGFWGKAGAQMVGNLGSNLAGMAVGALVDQGRQIYDFEKSLTRLGIAANKSPEFMRQFADSVRKTSSEVGISAPNVLSAARSYVALTGDMDGAAEATRTWARVAQATDSNIEDVAKTAAALKQNLKIDPKDMEAAFAALSVQGKEGAIELKDLAGQLANIAPQWAMFKGGSGVAGLKEMGAALQVVKQGFGGDASETVTGLQSLLTSLIKNAKNFKSAKVKIFDVDPTTHVKTMRNVLDIINDIGGSKLAKDPTKLEKAFGRVEAYRAYLQLSQNKQLLADLIAKSGDTAVIGRDLQRYMESPAGRIERAWEQVKNKIAEAATPERIEAFTTAVVKLADALSKIVGFVSAIGDGINVEATLAKEVTKGELLKADLRKLSPEQRAKLADELEQKAANLEGDDQATNAGRKGYAEAAKQLREQAQKADPGLAWAGPSNWNPMQFTTAMLDPGAAVASTGASAMAGVQQLAASVPGGNATLQKILDELKKLNATTGKGGKVEIDGKEAGRALKDSRAHAGRPGR